MSMPSIAQVVVGCPKTTAVTYAYTVASVLTGNRRDYMEFKVFMLVYRGSEYSNLQNLEVLLNDGWTIQETLPTETVRTSTEKFDPHAYESRSLLILKRVGKVRRE
jgi:hypothetical protein